MQFTLTDCAGPTMWELFMRSLLLALPVGVLLFIWLRRSARDVRDVLSAAPGLAAESLRPSFGLAEWVLPAVTILLPQVLATAMILYGLITPDSGWILGTYRPMW